MLTSLLFLAAAPQTERPLTKAEKSEIATHMGRELRDPYSARYDWWPLKSDRWYCATVNAKNAYGAYTGSEIFLVAVKKSGARITVEKNISAKLAQDSAVSATLCLNIYGEGGAVKSLAPPAAPEKGKPPAATTRFDDPSRND